MLCASAGWTSAGWAEDTIYERAITITQVAYDDACTNLVELPMNAAAGIILSLACDSDQSDDYNIYLYDENYELDTSTSGWWYDQSGTCRTNETLLVYSRDVSTTSFRDDDPFSFSCDDETNTTSLYLGIYNDDASLTATFNCKLRYNPRKNKDLGTATD